MKKQLKKFLITLITVFCTMSIALGATACGDLFHQEDGGTTPEPDSAIMAVYNSYVAAAKENDEEPMTYEEWYADLLANAKGEKGEKGEDGNTWLVGTTAPTAEDGKDGDLYLDYVTWNVWHKENGEWTVLGNLKGEIQPEEPDDQLTYTVTLYETDGRGNETRFYPSEGQYIVVQWTSEYSAFGAEFDENGVATKTGLDGEYRVTLSKLPTDSLGNQTHTYNPNGIIADSNNRDVKIVLIPIRTPVSGTGTSSFNPFFIQSEGAYSVTLTTGSGTSSQSWFRYIPQEPGIYTIETLVDADQNEINPTIRYYMSNMGGWVSTTPEVYPDGGYTNGGFTKNAKYEVYISGGDAAINEVGAPRLFTISAESIIGYPVRVYFSITFTPLASD